jgi:hypothetical protein
MGSRRVIDAEFEMRLMPGDPQAWTTFRGPDSAKAMTDFMRSAEGFRALGPALPVESRAASIDKGESDGAWHVLPA